MQMDYPTIFYSHVHVDIPHDLMKHVIGVNGRWFKHMCQKTMVNYIWFNKKRSLVEIWGPIQYLMLANYAVQSRINFIKDRYAPTPPSDFTWQKDSYYELDLNNPEHLIEKENVKFLIGKQGSNFKNITRQAGVSFIWYNPQNHNVQIWGLVDDINNAVRLLKDRISYINGLC
jgi:hypothetical protein